MRHAERSLVVDGWLRARLPSAAAAVLVVVISVYPFLYTLATSFKTGNALFDTSLLPEASPTAASRR